MEGCGTRGTNGKVPAVTGGRELLKKTGQGPVLLGLGGPVGDTSPASEQGPHWVAMWEVASEQSTVGTGLPLTHHCPSRRPLPALMLPDGSGQPNSTG